MRTTLVISDRIMRRLKALAAERRQTVSALVEAFLRKGLNEASEREVAPDLPPIPTFQVREVRVNVADRDALERALRDER